MISTEDQYIYTLNTEVKCKLAPSPIHGVGVFAIRDIQSGELLYLRENQREWFNIPFKRFDEIREEVRELVLQSWPIVTDGSAFLSPNHTVRLINFMNHSDDFNYSAWSDCAMQDIKKGEEVTEDYGRFKKFLIK